MPGKVSLTLIIPIYNEEELIHKAIATNAEVLELSNIDYEIIAVDDGSTDHSLQIINQSFTGLDKLTIFKKEKNEGLGSAVKKGVELASKEYISFMPADSPLTESVLNSFISNIGKADILVGYRKSRKGYSLRMKLNSKVYHWLISTLFHLRLKDYNWVHLYPKAIFEKVEITSKGIFMLAEVLIKAKWAGYTFYEFPVEYSERESGVPTASTMKAVFNTIKETFSFYFRNISKS